MICNQNDINSYRNKTCSDKMMLHGHSSCQIQWTLLSHRTQLLSTNTTLKLLVVVSAIAAEKCCFILKQITDLVWDKGGFRVNLRNVIHKIYSSVSDHELHFFCEKIIANTPLLLHCLLHLPCITQVKLQPMDCNIWLQSQSWVYCN